MKRATCMGFFALTTRKACAIGGARDLLTAPRMPPYKSIFLAVISALVATQTGAAASLTLEQALSSVETTNLSVLLSREAAVQALAASNVQRSALLPNVGLNAQQRRSETVSVSNTGVLNQSGTGNRFDGKLTGSLSLLNPQQISAFRAARAGVAVADADFQATLQSVMSSVAQIYFTHLRNLRRIAVLDANIARARSLADFAQKQFDAGVTTRIDVTRALSQLAIAEQARLQQDTVVYQSAVQLQRLLDLNPADPITLEDFNVRQVMAGDFALGLDQSTFAKRADWLRQQKVVEQAKLDVRTAKFERLPVLGANGEYGYAAVDAFNTDTKKAWFLGATVSLPVFDGLRAGADKSAALSRQRSQEARLHNLELQISAELRLAQQDAGSRFAQIAVADKSFRLAEEQVRLAQARLGAGAADNRELIEAQNSLAIASDAVVDAVYQYNLSRVELTRAKGDVKGILSEKQ